MRSSQLIAKERYGNGDIDADIVIGTNKCNIIYNVYNLIIYTT